MPILANRSKPIRLYPPVHLSLRHTIRTPTQLNHVLSRGTPQGDRPMIKLRVNRKDYTVNVSSDTPLLWVLRETLELNGTKFGCGMALCGACTVHLDGEAARSC